MERLDSLMFSRRKVPLGQALYRAEDKFQFIYAVRSGTFKSSLMLSDGREQVSGFHIAGELMGLDGVANGIEYFMGLSGSGFTALPGVVVRAGVRSVTWPKGSAYYGTYGVDFVVQTSTDLSQWSNAAIGVGPGYVTDSSGSVVFTLPAATKTFARLMVTGP